MTFISQPVHQQVSQVVQNYLFPYGLLICLVSQSREMHGQINPWSLFYNSRSLKLGKKQKYFYIYLFIWLIEVLAVACGIQFPDQWLNQSHLNWEHRVLATGPLRKSPETVKNKFGNENNGNSNYKLHGLQETFYRLGYFLELNHE